MAAMLAAKADPSPSTEASPFDELYQAWFGHVRRWARAMGAPAADLDDVTQEVFVVAHRKFELVDRSNAGPWLYGVCRNIVSSHRRQAWIRRVLWMRNDPALDHLIDTSSTPAESLETKERRLLIECVLAKMKPKQRTTFILFEVEGYSGEEIARLEGIPLKTAWSRLRLARQAFAKMLERARRARGQENK